MYSTNNATVNNDEFISNYMPVGINENVTLKEINLKKSSTNKDYIEFVFENESGQTAKFSEWKNEKNMWIKTDKDLQERDNQQFGRILQIISCYYDTVPEAEISTFAEMIAWVKKQLDTVDKSKKLRLKVIYDKKGYTTVSSFGIFVEPMTVEESQIKLFKRDLLERAVKADTETPADPLASDSTPNTETADFGTSTDANELPF